MARFAYFEGLTRAQQATYRRSDAVDEVRVPDPAPLRRYADQLADALGDADQVAAEQAAVRLASHLTLLLGIRPVSVRVFAARPRDETEELHGMYIREEGRRPVVHLWMRTAARGDVVSFKTFLRTLAHELCHHLDFELLGLDETFHTKGFFQRESHLVRQILPRGGRLRRAARAAIVKRAERGAAVEASELLSAQLELPIEKA